MKRTIGFLAGALLLWIGAVADAQLTIAIAAVVQMDGIILTPGSAPGSPVNGQCWQQTGGSAGLYCQVGGSPVGPFGSLNGLTITSSTGTFTLAAAKTLTVSNTLTFAGTDASTLNIGTGGTLGALAFITPGTGIATALGINIGSAGAPVLFNGAGGTPSSLILTSATGLPVAGGGTGAATLTGLVKGNGTSAFTIATAADIPATPATAGTNVTLTGPRAYYWCSGTCTVTLPVPVAGYEFCLRNVDNVATVITLAALGSSARYEQTARTGYGTAGTGTAVSSGAVTNQICLLGKDSTHYDVMSSTDAWVMN